ncbi:hypothetical protein AciX9_0914 [Granulicella tundricola MP5ACTX9]|uniref:Uncharacterized protein n=1 Tax=Granulicella tundricola (strain ATCC BAA-1859 / DSM 23138 / MP5ACTX9) TaxID=1198114 RepID=E8X1R2_GRATM|nr:hypothetical protein AciX9_0914 [Granulicella tundricola MP5ACTX9]
MLLSLILSITTLCTAQTPQHTAEAPGILEGPQAIGTAPALAKSPEPALMNNDAVLRMVKAGLGDGLVLQTINAQPGDYNVTPDALIALKQAGVSEEVISSMVNAVANKSRRQITNVPVAPVVLSDVNEPGVYYKDRQGRWTLMETELVHSKSGGFIKSTVTYGIISKDMNGVVFGRESKLLLSRPVEFLIYTPDGVTSEEYDLLQFRLNSKDREFRTLTGGVFHSTGGAKRDEVPFKAVKTAPHTYTFSLPEDLPGGEFGVLPPGTGNVTNGGKIYTFAISEDDRKVGKK